MNERRPEEKARKRTEAAARQAEYAALSTQAKVERARSRRGESRREIARLTGGK